MKICCLVKEVPDAAVQKRIDPGTKRLDRSGERQGPFHRRHVASRGSLETRPLEDFDQAFSDIAIVIDDENARHGAQFGHGRHIRTHLHDRSR